MSATVVTPETLSPAGEPTLYFIGVTTGSSSIMDVFPRWADRLRIPRRIVGIDIPLNAAPAAYRQVVEFIKNDELSLGALVTTHKLNLFKASRDLFDGLGESAIQLDEISCISKRRGQLLGHAMDDVTSGLALSNIVDSSYWLRTGADIVLLGAGGSALALTLHLHREKLAGHGVPSKLYVTNRREGRLHEMRELHASLGFAIPVEYILAPEPQVNDEVLLRAGDSSLVINATGLGKDRPGSPLSSAALFPMRSIAWDFNYRGDLLFLLQASSQRDSRQMRCVDGWFYFLHGWTRVISQVFDLVIPTSGPDFDELSAIAGPPEQ